MSFRAASSSASSSPEPWPSARRCCSSTNRRRTSILSIRVALVRLLRQQVRSGVSVVSVLHDLSLALLADRLVVMDRGRIHASGPSDDPALHRQLVEVFAGAIRVERFDERWAVIPRLDA